MNEQPAPPRALRRFLLWSLAGGAVGVVGTVLVLAIAGRDPTPRLTPEILAAARKRWDAVAPANYDVEVRVSGPQAATYRAEVRGGEARVAWRNGKPLASVRTFGTWSVPGMFSTIGRDIEAIERRAAGRAPPGAPELILKAQFDPQYSFPQRYRRIEWGSRKGSTAVAVTWEVVEFRVMAERRLAGTKPGPAKRSSDVASSSSAVRSPPRPQ